MPRKHPQGTGNVTPDDEAKAATLLKAAQEYKLELARNAAELRHNGAHLKRGAALFQRLESKLRKPPRKPRPKKPS